MPGGSSSPWLRYAGLGLELAGAVAILTLLGWWIDGRFGTAPWGVLLGALLGMTGGMVNLVREAMSATHPDAGAADDRKADDAGRRGGQHRGEEHRGEVHRGDEP